MKITIVTPSLNQREFLSQTLQSVLHQTGSFDLSHIVTDAQSTDGTVDLLQSVSDPRLLWISEPDTGQADAVNKGIALAEGDIIGWLNSDDLYLPGALHAVVLAFEDQSVQWAVGGCQIIDGLGNLIRPRIMRYKERSLDRYAYRRLLRENFIPQPAVFWRRNFGQTVGPLDTSLFYTMDYDLWLRMGARCDPHIIHRPLAQFRVHSTSKTGVINRKQFDEGYEVARRYFAGDNTSRLWHRFNIEKIVFAYRCMRMFGM